jgi:exodeoxyribonuclease VII large subunit
MAIERGFWDDDPVEPAPPKKAPVEPRRAAPVEPTSDTPPEKPAAPKKVPVLTVTELTRKLAGLLQGLGRVRVEGEVSRVSRAASGHLYFDLKDLDAKISCKLWKSQRQAALRFDLEEGMRVIAHGSVDVYPPRGEYSLVVGRVERAGLGELLARLEELKARLRERGWFDRARPLPFLPRRIGVVTSRDGAAFQDVLKTRHRRWPGYALVLAHTQVQGPGASRRIAEALRRLDACGVDVIVLCRGGGSIEDLWAFNELPVAEAIWACSVPVISGVGHETDVTLADHVSDLRAHTPTDAAQSVIPERAVLTAELARARGHLTQAMNGVFARREHSLRSASTNRVLRDPRWILGARGRTLAHLFERLRNRSGTRVDRSRALLSELHRRIERRSPKVRLEEGVGALRDARRRLAQHGKGLLGPREHHFELLSRRLDDLSPLKILGRGYSITRKRGAAALRDAAQVQVGDQLETRLARGTVYSNVTRTE